VEILEVVLRELFICLPRVPSCSISEGFEVDANLGQVVERQHLGAEGEKSWEEARQMLEDVGR